MLSLSAHENNVHKFTMSLVKYVGRGYGTVYNDCRLCQYLDNIKKLYSRSLLADRCGNSRDGLR